MRANAGDEAQPQSRPSEAVMTERDRLHRLP
jgi:hypothetical protein